MNRLTEKEKISFLKILFSFMNMDGTFSDNEENTIQTLKNKVFKIGIKDSDYRIFTKDISELSTELDNLDCDTQNILFKILDEVLANNRYEDSKFYKKSKKEKEAIEILNLLKKGNVKCS